jgi:hypothetical protein
MVLAGVAPESLTNAFRSKVAPASGLLPEGPPFGAAEGRRGAGAPLSSFEVGLNILFYSWFFVVLFCCCGQLLLWGFFFLENAEKKQKKKS